MTGGIRVRRVAQPLKYYTRQELQSTSPSIKDGLTPEKEKIWRRQYVCLIRELARRLAM